MQAPTKRNMIAAERVLRYLAGTQSMKLSFGRHRESTAEQDRDKVKVIAFADADWAALDVPRPVTVSIGVASAGPAGTPGPRSWRELFDIADLHLFAAKRSGRNRVRATGQQPSSVLANRAALLPATSVDDLVAEVLSGAPRRPGWAFDDGEVAS